jgi:hypothetical protein
MRDALTRQAIVRDLAEPTDVRSPRQAANGGVDGIDEAESDFFRGFLPEVDRLLEDVEAGSGATLNPS